MTEILDGNVNAFERLRPPGLPLTLPDAQQLVVDTIEPMERATRGHITVADALLRIAADRVGNDRPIRILEVASGSGWLLRNLWTRAAHHRIGIELTGSDLKPNLVASMQPRFTTADIPLEVRVANACSMKDVADGKYHIAIINFTLHHLPERDAPAALRELDRVSGGGMILVDATRRRLALAAVPTMATLLAPRGGHRFARHDAIATVRRAYTTPELKQLVDDAGLGHRYQVGPLPTRHPERLIAQAVWPTRQK